MKVCTTPEKCLYPPTSCRSYSILARIEQLRMRLNQSLSRDQCSSSHHLTKSGAAIAFSWNVVLDVIPAMSSLDLVQIFLGLTQPRGRRLGRAAPLPIRQRHSCSVAEVTFLLQRESIYHTKWHKLLLDMAIYLSKLSSATSPLRRCAVGIQNGRHLMFECLNLQQVLKSSLLLRLKQGCRCHIQLGLTMFRG